MVDRSKVHPRSRKTAAAASPTPPMTNTPSVSTIEARLAPWTATASGSTIDASVTSSPLGRGNEGFGRDNDLIRHASVAVDTDGLRVRFAFHHRGSAHTSRMSGTARWPPTWRQVWVVHRRSARRLHCSCWRTWPASRRRASKPTRCSQAALETKTEKPRPEL